MPLLGINIVISLRLSVVLTIESRLVCDYLLWTQRPKLSGSSGWQTSQLIIAAGVDRFTEVHFKQVDFRGQKRQSLAILGDIPVAKKWQCKWWNYHASVVSHLIVIVSLVE